MSLPKCHFCPYCHTECLRQTEKPGPLANFDDWWAEQNWIFIIRPYSYLGIMTQGGVCRSEAFRFSEAKAWSENSVPSSRKELNIWPTFAVLVLQYWASSCHYDHSYTGTPAVQCMPSWPYLKYSLTAPFASASTHVVWQFYNHLTHLAQRRPSQVFTRTKANPLQFIVHIWYNCTKVHTVYDMLEYKYHVAAVLSVVYFIVEVFD